MPRESSSRDRKGEVESISFRPAKGGVVSETGMKYKRGGQGGGPLHDYEHETAVHPSLEHATAHLKAHLGHCFSGGPADREKDGGSED